MKYRKKPVVVDAIKWTGDNFDEIETFTDKKGFMDKVVGGSEDGEGYPQVYEKLVIPTLEGFHSANVGDWIIKGIKGEFYPCKPDIFEATYENVQ